MEVKALITAAGLGKRFGALTKRKNKALFRIQDKSLIFHIVEKLKAQGLKNIIVVTGFQNTQVKKSGPPSPNDLQ